MISSGGIFRLCNKYNSKTGKISIYPYNATEGTEVYTEVHGV
jgi:hypothetical protein